MLVRKLTKCVAKVPIRCSGLTVDRVMNKMGPVLPSFAFSGLSIWPI
jgi:hypothetical protein